MKLLKETNRRVVSMAHYRGVCDGCGSPFEYEEDLIVVLVFESPEKDIVAPIDDLRCPYCDAFVNRMTVYHNMDISQELGK